MTHLNIKTMLLLTTLFLGIACNTDVTHDIATVEAPVQVSSTPEEGAVNVKAGIITLTVTYDKNVFFATKDAEKITLNGLPVLTANVLGSGPMLSITAKVEKATAYQLTIPEGVVLGPNKSVGPAISLHFTTTALTKTLVTAGASAEAQRVFTYLLENHEQKTLSGTMAQVNWNTQQADRVYALTGKYPALNCFDYVHLYASPTNWIDYSNTTVVENWWNKNGLVAAMWHWNVPSSAGGTNYGFYATGKNEGDGETSFDISKAVQSGTYEHGIIMADLNAIATHLLLLKAKNIPVIWRPLHEAAGGWFWWGAKDATSYKVLWKLMFDTFQAKGLNNLIWVWTCETGDEAWYPGDAYVDIVGRDLYGKGADDAAREYTSIGSVYGNKMITLSECGANAGAGVSMATISAQWAAGVRWLYFMPWYDNAGASVQHATDAWWQDAMSQEYVISRGELPSLK